MNTGTAFGAVTVLNATATGHGCALATQAGVTATWEWQGEGLIVSGAPDSKLAKACYEVASRSLRRTEGASIEVTSVFPHARGLKTSSAAATAMLRAAGVEEENIEGLAVEAAKLAQVTLTGAYDDQVAVTRGGCHLTNNSRHQIIASFFTEPWHVAVWVPEAKIDKSFLKRIDPAPIQRAIEAAENRLLADDIPGALSKNGLAFTRLYEAAGLPVSFRPADVAMAAGAVGAGLSGTGPAVAALFDFQVDLPGISGGTWHWTRAQEMV